MQSKCIYQFEKREAQKNPIVLHKSNFSKLLYQLILVSILQAGHDTESEEYV